MPAGATQICALTLGTGCRGSAVGSAFVWGAAPRTKDQRIAQCLERVRMTELLTSLIGAVEISRGDVVEKVHGCVRCALLC